MDKRRKALTALIISSAFFFMFYTAARDRAVDYKFTQPAMGTIFTVTIYGMGEPAARDAAREAFSLAHSIEADLSRFREDSELSKVNRDPAATHKIGAHFFECLSQAVAVSELTCGYFDVTFFPLYRAWDWRNNPTSEPSRETIEALLSRVGYKKIALDAKDRTVRMLPSMMLDFGGVAKGYAVGRMAKRLSELGVKDAIVNGGGDLVITSKRPYVIGLQDPGSRERGAIIGRIILEGPAAVFTSGDYEQYAVINGKKYGHIIDPHTGYPASGLRSATVVDADPYRAPGISAGVIAMGAQRARVFVEKENIAALLVDESGEVYISRRFGEMARFVRAR